MEDTVSEEALQKKIQELEARQKRELEKLKSQFRHTYNDLQPANLIKSTIHTVIKTPEVQDDLLNAGISLVTGYLAKKITVGKSDSAVKTILGDLVQLGVTTTVAKHPDEIKAVLKKVVELALSVQQTASKAVDEEPVRRRLMKEIMQLTDLIQSAHPQLYIILEETPLPVADTNNKISVKSLKAYRDALKLQLMQFGNKGESV